MILFCLLCVSFLLAAPVLIRARENLTFQTSSALGVAVMETGLVWEWVFPGLTRLPAVHDDHGLSIESSTRAGTCVHKPDQRAGNHAWAKNPMANRSTT